MIETATVVAIISGIALLVLNGRAMRGAAEQAGHGPRQLFQMAAIWAMIIAGVTLLVGLFQS